MAAPRLRLHLRPQRQSPPSRGQALTSDGANAYLYDVENRLVSRTGGGTSAALRYDPLGRLYEVNGSATGTTRFLYDGDALVAEYNVNAYDPPLRRYVHGSNAGTDDPVIWFESPYVANGYQRYLFTDERGSIVAVTDSTGAAIAINAYDEYGIPAAGNQGRFQYTGQAWLPELGMYYYKARIYSPTLGRFLQTDPIGYEDQYNLYAYVGNDPVNSVDYTGLKCETTDRGVRCTVEIEGSGENGEITKEDRENALRLAKAQLKAFLIAQSGEKKGAQAYVRSMRGAEGFLISASSVKRILGERTVTYKPKLNPKSDSGAEALMGTTGRGRLAATSVYGGAKDVGMDRLVDAFLHEAIHESPEEARAGWSGRMNVSPYDRLHQLPFQYAVQQMEEEW